MGNLTFQEAITHTIGFVGGADMHGQERALAIDGHVARAALDLLPSGGCSPTWKEIRADAATLVNWSVWRWQIENFFKRLKSSGHHLEAWGQRDPKALLKRLLIASMARGLVWQLARDQSPPAQAAAALLMRLSGRQTNRAKPVTEAALLAGLWSLLGVLNVLEDHSLDELRATAQFILGQLV